MIRIVKMQFNSDDIGEFLLIFNNVQPKITNMEGCRSLQLLRDINNRDIIFTISHWDHPEALENYRKSDLFTQTWSRARRLFAQKAEAWSVEEV